MGGTDETTRRPLERMRRSDGTKGGTDGAFPSISLGFLLRSRMEMAFSRSPFAAKTRDSSQETLTKSFRFSSSARE